MTAPRPLTEADLQPLQTAMPADFPAIWRDIATSLYSAFLRECGPHTASVLPPVPDGLARLAVELTVTLANDIGGDTVYIPIGHFMRAGETARKVIAAFRGHNHHEVARLCGITVSRVRQILREHQRAAFESRQGKLELQVQ